MSFELFLCNTLTVFLGTFFAIFALLNVISRFGVLGRFGARFAYEMDVIMGGLLGIPYYSLVEAVLFAVAAYGMLNAMFGPTPTNTWPLVGLLIGTMYLGMVNFYAVFSKQPLTPFVTLTVISGSLFVWRLVRFTDPLVYGELVKIGLVCVVLAAVGTLRMMSKAGERAEVNAQFVRMQKFCDDHPDYEWIIRENGPVGFTDSDTSVPLITS